MHQEDDRLRAVAPMQAEGRETKTQRQAENQNQGASLIAQETGETVMDVVASDEVDPLPDAAHPPRDDA